MTDPNTPPQYGQQAPPPYAQHRPQPYGPGPYQPGPGQGQPPHYGPPPGQWPPQPPAKTPRGPFGPSFWITASILVLILLTLTGQGQGEGILVVTGLTALLTALYAIVFRRPSWAGLPTQRVAGWVAIAGLCCALLGTMAFGASGSRSASAQPAPVSAPVPTTSAQLEAEAAAKLKAREDAVAKREAEVAVKETPVKTFGEGTWTVGTDLEPGTYRTTQAVVGDCSWKITRTGSNGKDSIAYDYFVKGGFPQVTLAEGQTFNTDGCGDWAKR